MSVFRMYLNLGRRVMRYGPLALVLSATTFAVHAQTPPYAEFQYSTLTASGNTVMATRVPVVTVAGTIYENVTILFDVAADGTLTIAPGYPKVIPAPPTLISNFLAGNYVGPATHGNYLITVNGAGVTQGGATEWSLLASSGASCYTTPNSATWYVFGGPMTKHPLYQRLKAAGISSTTYGFYSWGTTGDQGCDTTGNWATNSLVGLSQTGNGLTIVSFTHGGVDQSQPADSAPYTKIK